MTNIGTIDRMLRFFVGLVLVVLPLATDILNGWGAWKYAGLVIGLVMLVTALTRFCPAYMLFGVRTCALPKK
jgi:Protein of unknown function (DUF2892)